MRVVSCIDLTTLAGDDTLANVQRLCFKAKQPVCHDLMTAMGFKDLCQYVIVSILFKAGNSFPQ